MKKLMSSMLVMAAMTSMISCSTEDVLDNKTPDNANNGLVPIKMTAAIGHITTKGAINQDEITGALKENLTNVSFLRWDATNAEVTEADWTTLNPFLSATIKQDGNISFDETQYYKNDGLASYLFGVYPSNGATITENSQLQWTLDGTKDIIISDVQHGDKKTTEALPFKFEHKLTLFKFYVKLPTGSTATGEKLSSITVKNQNSTAIYDPTTKTFTFSDPTQDMTTDNPSKDEITTAGISGGSLLVDPIKTEGGREFEVEVATTKDATTKKYAGKITIGAKINTAYDVQLVISQQAVTGQATIGYWTPGDKIENQEIY